MCRKETMKLRSFRGSTLCELLTEWRGMKVGTQHSTWFGFGWSGCTQPLLNVRCQDLWSAVLPMWRNPSVWAGVRCHVYGSCKENGVAYYNTKLNVFLRSSFYSATCSIRLDILLKTDIFLCHITLLYPHSTNLRQDLSQPTVQFISYTSYWNIFQLTSVAKFSEYTHRSSLV
jgi:hypothetical protein